MRRHMVIRDGGARDSAYFSVLDYEWLELKPVLERRRHDHATRSG